MQPCYSLHVWQWIVFSSDLGAGDCSLRSSPKVAALVASAFEVGAWMDVISAVARTYIGGLHAVYIVYSPALTVASMHTATTPDTGVRLWDTSKVGYELSAHHRRQVVGTPAATHRCPRMFRQKLGNIHSSLSPIGKSRSK